MATKDDNQKEELMELPESERLIEEGRELLDSVYFRMRQRKVLTEEEFQALCQAKKKMERAYSAISIRREKLGDSIFHLKDAIEPLLQNSTTLPLFLAIWRRNGAGFANFFSLILRFRKGKGKLINEASKSSYQLAFEAFSELSVEAGSEAFRELPEPERLLGESQVLLDSVFEQIGQEEVLFADEFQALCRAILTMDKAYFTLSIRRKKLDLSIGHLKDVIERLEADDRVVSIDTQRSFAHAHSGYPN
ncbi:hypothetical protein MK805_05180 [Shimazuella sp. AN120528]|uniref:hypothetical protein n=1 Tax=Shimazuella soli TaxID=1892854 RepID=UPI001F0FA1B0|nr:hypothetical protein [Shimazuella soli]MCH5584362.1 hypothetical protein [Shimazuella soli]